MKQKIGRSYIKCRLKWIAAVTGCGIVMTAVLFLNEVPAGEIAYGMLLCLGILLLAVTMDRISYGRRHRELLALRQSITVSLGNLPEPGEILEEDYQQLLGLLAEEKMRIWNTAVSEKRDLMEYYTMWVHQIKTPIAAMRLLLQKPGQEQDPELSEQLFRIEEYVNMVLQYLRVDGDNDLVVQWNDLDLMVRQAVHRYAGMFIRKKLSLSYEPLNRKVLTDEKWLVFAVEQILSNAVKYTGQGGISIYLEPGPDTVLAIRDTGTGIALEDQPRIFEKGFTGYNGHADKRSTGIGLYLCRRILNRLSHEITVESEPGKGTIMRIWFAKERLEVE